MFPKSKMKFPNSRKNQEGTYVYYIKYIIFVVERKQEYTSLSKRMSRA